MIDTDAVSRLAVNAAAADALRSERGLQRVPAPHSPPDGEGALVSTGHAPGPEWAEEMIKNLKTPRVFAEDEITAAHGIDDPPAPGPEDDLPALTALTAPNERVSADWPSPPGGAAFHGLAGEFVRLVGPHTEADAAALLLDFLVLAGNAIGRTAHVRVGASVHYANTYVVVVGESGAGGRKGTAFSEARRPFALVGPDAAGHNVGGVVSGEGIIWAVRDPIYKRERDKASGQYLEVMVDPGVADKRLVLREAEFSQVLRVAGRDSNTTSVTLREAWDDEDVLQTLAKNSPATATGAHVSMVADITPAELQRELTATDKANGFGNRILWCCSRRSKELAEPAPVDPDALSRIADALGAVLSETRSMGPVVRDEGARELWSEVYGFLTRNRPGLLGSLLARAEAQVVRLSLIFAVLDTSHTIRREHLEAALAVWDYCERSASHLFGNALGDPTADDLLAALRRQPNGMTRDEMRNHFGRHRSSAEIARALALLESLDLASMASEQTGGRPRERWTLGRDKRDKRGKGAES